MKRTVIITGGGGFIMSHVADILVENGYYVVVIDDLSGGFRENLPEACVFVHGSINDVKLVDDVFATYEPFAVLHGAAYAAEGLSPFIRRFNYQNNLIGSINLINASVNFNVECFTFLSSIAVYGHGVPPFTEEHMPTPCDPYGISKYAVELDLQAAHRTFGLNYVIFRPHNVYGERQNIADPYRNVIGIFMNQAMRGEPMTVFGDGTQTRAFSYIDGVAPAIAASIDRPECWNQVINIGGSIPYSIHYLANSVAQVFGMEEAQIKLLPARDEVTHAHCLHDKARQFFGDLDPQTVLSHGLRNMAEWAKSRGPQVGQKFSNIEITRNLPPSWAALQ